MHLKTLLFLFILYVGTAYAQETTEVDSDTTELSDFDKFNKKAEKLFVYLPVPIYSYTQEAGHIFGLAKYNLIDLDRDDTISQPSKFAELITVSTEGRIKVAVTTDLIWHENKYMYMAGIVYNKQSEYIMGIGNTIDTSKIEEYGYDRFMFVNTFYMMMFEENLYAGLGFDITNYTSITYDSLGILSNPEVTGTQPGTNFGVVLAVLRDARDNRYNAYSGSYLKASYTFFPSFLGNPYLYQVFTFDARKYFNPWYKHVIALQATTTFCNGDVPFYDLAMLGGDSQMRGYYYGALRDNVLVDAQIEYRLPIWNIFGIATWLGTGRVGDGYNDLSLDGFYFSYGGGLRIKVDSKNDTNLRLDLGFGKGQIKGFYVGFSEAF